MHTHTHTHTHTHKHTSTQAHTHTLSLSLSLSLFLFLSFSVCFLLFLFFFFFVCRKGTLDDDELQETIDEVLVRLAHQCLDLQWLEDERKPISNATLSRVLAIYLSHSTDGAAVQVVQRGMMELLAGNKSAAPRQSARDENAGSNDPNGSGGDGDAAPTTKRAKTSQGKGAQPTTNALATLVKGTFLTYLRACMQFAAQRLLELTPQLVEAEDEEMLSQLRGVCHVFGFSVQLTRHRLARSKAVLATVVKAAKQFVDQFSKAVMPFLARCLKHQPAVVIMLLKETQKSTRHLQSICNHSKVVQDVVLTSYVPALKRSLETLVFKAQAMLIDNNCHEAFSVGVLKHKGLDGQEVSSQVVVRSEQGDDDDEEEDDEEEDDSDSDDADNDAGDGDNGGDGTAGSGEQQAGVGKSKQLQKHNDAVVSSDEDDDQDDDEDDDEDEHDGESEAANNQRRQRAGKRRVIARHDDSSSDDDDDDDDERDDGASMTNEGLSVMDVSLEADEGVRRALQSGGKRLPASSDDDDDDDDDDDEGEEEEGGQDSDGHAPGSQDRDIF